VTAHRLNNYVTCFSVFVHIFNLGCFNDSIPVLIAVVTLCATGCDKKKPCSLLIDYFCVFFLVLTMNTFISYRILIDWVFNGDSLFFLCGTNCSFMCHIIERRFKNLACFVNWLYDKSGLKIHFNESFQCNISAEPVLVTHTFFRNGFPCVIPTFKSHKMGTGSFPGLKCGRGVLLTTHPLLAPRSWKNRAILLPTLWATPNL